MWDLAPRRFILFTSEFADFVGDLLRSFRQTSSVSVRKQNPTIPRPERDYELGVRIYECKLIFVNFVKIYFEMKSLFFCLIKRTKNQGFGIVVKAQFSIFFLRLSLRGALFCSLLKMLILSVICYAASSKSLAFQFVHKTQQYQGQRVILNWELGFVNEINLSWVWDDLFWNELFVLLLDQKNEKSRLRDCC